jgi:hypothetical protein
MFGNEMSVNPEVGVQNAHETMHELTHLHESNDSREIGILSFKNDPFVTVLTKPIWQHYTRQ